MKHVFNFLILLFFLSCTSNVKTIQNQNMHSFSKDLSKSELIYLGNGWFKITESVVIENITPEEAKDKAITKACKNAIEYYSGVEVSGRIVNVKVENQNKILLDRFSSLTEQTIHGIITNKEILKDETKLNGNQLVKVITIKVKVMNQSGVKDPTFHISANLNRDYFKNTEMMELSIKSSKDCYITVLNICSNDSVYVIFPNKHRKNNFIRSGDTFKLPNSTDIQNGIHFPINLHPSKNEDTEIIKIIATKKKIDFSSLYSLSAYGTYQSTLIDLQKWLIKIPRNEIEEQDLQYFIVK